MVRGREVLSGLLLDQSPIDNDPGRILGSLSAREFPPSNRVVPGRVAASTGESGAGPRVIAEVTRGRQLRGPLLTMRMVGGGSRVLSAPVTPRLEGSKGRD